VTTRMDAKDEAQASLKARAFPLGEYRHYKGPCYWVFAVSIDEETLEPLVHYKSLIHETLWTRKMSNFAEEVDLPSGEKKPRFEHIGYKRVGIQ
jgi:hypothetical protein